MRLFRTRDSQCATEWVTTCQLWHLYWALHCQPLPRRHTFVWQPNRYTFSHSTVYMYQTTEMTSKDIHKICLWLCFHISAIISQIFWKIVTYSSYTFVMYYTNKLIVCIHTQSTYIWPHWLMCPQFGFKHKAAIDNSKHWSSTAIAPLCIILQNGPYIWSQQFMFHAGKNKWDKYCWLC